ncbi:MAG: preprotein translocase subunit YajC [Phycisphaerae bacterium]|nr:preprotein translocase subunit YajC [Phycisphaerae bacterium]
MNKRLTLSLCLALLAAFTIAPAFAQDDTVITPGRNQAPPAPGGEGAGTGTGTAEGQGPQERRNEDGGFGSWLLPLMIGLLVVMFVFSSRSRKKQEAKRREMLDAIKKGDTVTSIGGIIGTVAEVREKDVIVKIDDTTRIKLARWAIRGIGDDSMSEAERKDGQK